ncbi:MAG: protein kinase domain-containing protein [Panacagrimonas sp.]
MDLRDTPRDAALYRYRFGTAEFDEARFELRVGGLPVELERRPLEVLLELLRHAGEVVTREELRERVWAGRVTVDNVVANAVTKLRKALGDANAEMLVTQSRVGLRLVGTVERVAVGRKLVSVLKLAAGDPVQDRSHFRLEQQLGSSLANEVWTARHAHTGELRVFKFALDGERLSALKREATLSRLLREALGQREDIARIIDWNFETEPFFLECEFGGQNLSEWARDGALAALAEPQRIELFLQIADAVAAAHTVGVLHKDLKPANVLVQIRADQTRQLRLTDFGSARLLQPGRLEELGITRLGMTVTQGSGGDSTSGTPLYLAPELIAGHAPTVQSDLYALGVMLYQLAIGDLKKPIASGWERDIDDVLLREDIARAVDGNPLLRMGSVPELARALRDRDARRVERERLAGAEHAARIAVEALMRSRARRPWLIGAISVLIAGLATSLWLYDGAQVARDQAERERERSAAINRFLNSDVLGAADPYLAAAGRETTVREALSSAALALDDRTAAGLDRHPLTQASVRMTLAALFLRLQQLPESEAQWRAAIERLAEVAGEADPLALQSRYQLSQVLVQQSRFDEARQLLEETDRLAEKAPEHDARTAVFADHAWGVYLTSREDNEQAVTRLQDALTRQRQLDPADVQRIDAIRSSLMFVHSSLGRYAESERLARELLAELEARPSVGALSIANARHLLGEALTYQDRYDEAEPLLDQAVRTFTEKLGADSPRSVSVLNTQCSLYNWTERFQKAHDCMLRVHQALLARHGDGHWMVWGTLGNVANASYRLGRPVEAEREYRLSYEGLARTGGGDFGPTLLARYHLAALSARFGKADEAAALLAGLTVDQLKAYTPAAPWEQRLTLLRGLVLLAQGQEEAGRALLEPQVAAWSEAGGSELIFEEAKAALSRSD